MQTPRIRAFAVRRLLTSLSLACICLTAAAADTADALDLARFRGKVVLVAFWASWCEPCRHSFPWLNAMQAKYVDRVRADAARFLQDVPAGFQIVYDPDGTLASHYDLPGMPVSYRFKL